MLVLGAGDGAILKLMGLKINHRVRRPVPLPALLGSNFGTKTNSAPATERSCSDDPSFRNRLPNGYPGICNRSAHY